MAISIRLGKELEQALRARAARDQIALSELIRQAIEEKLAREEQPISPYQLGKDLFCKYSSERSDLSANRKALLRERLDAKHRSR